MERFWNTEKMQLDGPFIKLEKITKLSYVHDNDTGPWSNENSRTVEPSQVDPLTLHSFDVPLIKEEPEETFASIIIKKEPEDCVGLYDDTCTSHAFLDTALIFPVKEEVVKEEPEREDFLAIVYDETKVIDIEAKPPVNNVRRSRKSLGVVRTELKTEKKKKISALCSECGVNFKTVASLKKHFEKAHQTKLSTTRVNDFVEDLPGTPSVLRTLGDNASKDDSDSEFFGDLPLSVELQQGSRRKNLGTIRDEEPEFEEQFPSLCTQCGKTFSCEGYLRKHFRQVHEKLSLPQHICDVCGKVCYGLAKFNAHVSTHTAVAESCKICGKSVKSIKTHMYYHRFPEKLAERVNCHICGKVLSKYYLAGHIEAVHDKHPTGVYPCELCAEVFYRFEEFRTHKVEAHHRKMPVNCPVCNKIFAGNRILNRHLKIHRTPCFQCDVCGKMFKIKISVRMHLKRCHFNVNQ